MDKFDLEISILTKKADYALESAYLADEINVLESGDDDDFDAGFFENLMTKFKEFVAKIKKAITDKINELKFKKSLDKVEKMWKQNIKAVKPLTDFAEEKEIIKLMNDVISKSTKLTKKLYDAKTISEIDALLSQEHVITDNANRQLRSLRRDFLYKVNKNGWNSAISTQSIDSAVKITNKASAEIERIARTKKASDKAKEITKSANNAIKRVTTSMHSFCNKCVSLISRNKGKIINATIIAAGAYTATKAVDYFDARFEANESSYDDILGDLFDEYVSDDVDPIDDIMNDLF